MYGKLEILIGRVLAKLHPSNLVNKIFCSVFNVAIHRLHKIQFWKSYLPWDSHTNIVISDRFAYPSRWHRRKAVIRAIALPFMRLPFSVSSLQCFHMTSKAARLLFQNNETAAVLFVSNQAELSLT